jgi:hypothetical protein
VATGVVKWFNGQKANLNQADAQRVIRACRRESYPVRITLQAMLAPFGQPEILRQIVSADHGSIPLRGVGGFENNSTSKKGGKHGRSQIL